MKLYQAHNGTQPADERIQDIVIGHNYRLLGATPETAGKKYCKELSQKLEWVQQGFANEVPVPDYVPMEDLPLNFDGKFLMKNIFRQLNGWKFEGYTEYHSGVNEFFIPGEGNTYYGVFRHCSIALRIVVAFSTSVYVGGGAGQHFSLKIAVQLTEKIPLALSWKPQYGAEKILTKLKPRVCGSSTSYKGENIQCSFTLEGNFTSTADVGNYMQQYAAYLQSPAASCSVVAGDPPNPFVYPKHVHTAAHDDAQFWKSLEEIKLGGAA